MMLRLSIFTSFIALTGESFVQASKLHARDCAFTWPAYEGDTCASMANAWSISEADFASYNPGAICDALEQGKEYCVEWSGTPPNNPAPSTRPSPVPSITPSTLFTSTVRSSTPVITTASPTPTAGTCSSSPPGIATPSPIQPGLVCGCTKFYKIVPNDGCWAVATAASITLDDFYAWNPSTAPECRNLVPGNYVCIGKGNTATPTTTPKPTISAPFTLVLCSWDAKKGQYICPGVTSTATSRNPAPGPTQSGIPSNCNKWVLQKDGVYCYDMAKTAEIALDRLYALNPALKSDCSGLWPGYAYCLGTS